MPAKHQIGTEILMKKNQTFLFNFMPDIPFTLKSEHGFKGLRNGDKYYESYKNGFSKAKTFNITFSRKPMPGSCVKSMGTFLKPESLR